MSGVIPASGIDGLELIWRPPVDQGRWVAERLQLTVRTTEAHLGVPLTDLVGLAVRRNPRRAHLLVSAVLGKHVPADPRLVHATGRLLGLLAASALSDRPDDAAFGQQFGEQFGEQFGPLLLAAVRAEPGAASALLSATFPVHPVHPADPDARVPLVLGYAETATALGHSVADALGAPYLHSTRRPVPGFDVHGSFQEEHSHATTHLLLPADRHLLHGDEPLVLVDDELSTGRTALNTIAELQAASPRSRYLIAALVDMRGPEDKQLAGQLAEQLGVRIDVVSLVSGQTDLPDDVLLRGQRVLAETADPQPVLAVQRAELVRCTAQWPADVREGGRHGFTVADERKVSAVAVDIAEALLPELAGNDVLVLGFEELMYAPMRIGAELAELVGLAITVRFSSTTRSPVLPVDDPGYPVRTRIEFPAHDQPADGPAARYAYNVAPAAGGPAFSDIVLVVDDAGAGPPLEADGGLVDQLRNLCARVHLLVVPTGVRAGAGGFPKPLHGPDFGSFDEAEVTWLLTDLSAAELEAPLEEREEAVQSGRAHYAESLPVEYQPSEGYQQLFEDALNRSAGRVAQAVASVAEQVLQARGRNVVLVSLARAGTPIGILLRRWLLLRHRIEVPHYSVSIVRGKGIDETALGYLAAMHDPADVMFIDAWTGKGAIARELAAAVELANDGLGLATGHRFDPELAVLADTGHCTRIFGTRDDFLIPSACLNATVHGLVSRTVLNDQWIRPGMFHGAKFYSELAGADRSAQFLTAVSAEFAGIGEVAVPAEGDLVHTAPTWAGWAAVERVRNEYGIADINLVKPGVGETTRVLLRRIPWKVLVRSGDQADLAHIRQLATERGVEIVEIDDLAYSCIGLIRPSGTATG